MNHKSYEVGVPRSPVIPTLGGGVDVEPEGEGVRELSFASSISTYDDAKW